MMMDDLCSLWSHPSLEREVCSLWSHPSLEREMCSLWSHPSLEREVCFDILEDLSEELLATDYIEFLNLNELTRELWESMITRYKFYMNTFKDYPKGSIAGYVGIIGDLEFIKWSHQTCRINVGETMFIGACCGGRINVIDWMYSIAKTRKVSGREELVGWSVDLEYPLYKAITFEKIFEIACQHGQLDVAKWVMKKTTGNSWWAPDRSPISYWNDIVKYVCYGGDLEFVKWLSCICCGGSFVMGKHTISTVCSKGKPEIIIWLIEKYYKYHDGKVIDYTCSIDVIDYACASGDEDLVWLLCIARSLEITDHAIWCAQDNGHLELAEKLMKNK